MAILNLIEFLDDSGEVMVVKMPMSGSGEFQLGSQLVVQESQRAIFYKNGQSLDMFDPGRHTLTTQNLPLLGSIIGAPFGGNSPFRSYVYFISTQTFTNLGWGTPSPVVFRDADFKMISLRAHGAFSVKIADIRTFLATLVGTKGIETTHALEDFFRTIIVSRLNQIIGSSMNSILDLPVRYNDISLSLRQEVKEDFGQYGILLVDLLIEAITPPAEVQEMINKAAGISVQDVDKYTAITAADAMKDAANNPSGSAGEGIGTGLGLAMGLGMVNQFSSQHQQGSAVLCSSCGHKTLESARYCPCCGQSFTQGAHQKPVPESSVVCDKCETSAKLGTKFCPNCGDPFNCCPECGTDNSDGISACIGCGSPLPIACPSCSEQVPGNTKFCPHCGGQVAVACVPCGATLPASAGFCPECGNATQ